MTLQLRTWKIPNMLFSCQARKKSSLAMMIIEPRSSPKQKSHQCNPFGLLSPESKHLTTINLLPVIFKDKEMSKCYEFVTLPPLKDCTFRAV